MLSVKEIFFTLQGEGANAGRAAIFCRFAGCNLWSGREDQRHEATCKFCDTDFVGTDGTYGGRYTATQLSECIASLWPGKLEGGPATAVDRNRAHGARPLVVFTGGEPLLQLTEELVAAVHGFGFEVAVETNGTLDALPTIDWICVSPKAGAQLVQRSGQELKVVFPQEGLDLQVLRELHFEHYFLQPMDGPSLRENTALALEYCLAHPEWRLSLQTHKMLGIR